MTGVREFRTNARRRWFGVLAVAAILAGCSSPGPTPGPSASPAATTGPIDTGTATAPPSLSPTAAAPTAVPTEPPASPGTLITDGYHFDDILKIQVNGLAVRTAPTKTARLVHQYLILGTTASDLGEVRLDKGSFVKVQLGPLRVGTITWYLVWPAANASLDDQTSNWYDQAPLAGQPVPAWIATGVGTTRYTTLERRPTAGQIAAVEVPGLVVAGIGNYTSPSMPRHDAFQLWWAAATDGTATTCAFKVRLVPGDADFAPLAAVDASTTSVKATPVAGTPLPWIDAGSASWSTFTLQVNSTCRWAVRLIRLEHD